MLLVPFLVVGSLFCTTAHALWPFPSKRFSTNGLIDATALGIDNGLRIVAFGDFGGDQFLDVVTLSEDQLTVSIYQWNHDDFTFTKNSSLSAPNRVVNVIPGDFTRNGKLDLLVMSLSADNRQQTKLDLYIAEHEAFNPEPAHLQPSTLAQPIALDGNGDLQIDLLGSSSSSNGLTLWKNIGNGKFDTIPFLPNACSVSTPHSNAFLDLNGDCLADIFLVCDGDSRGQQKFQVWVNNKSGDFSLAHEGKLPAGSGTISFADMDRDGTLDLIVPTCASVSTTTGIGTDCTIHIIYNNQLPLCHSGIEPPLCRPPTDLCTGDAGFQLGFEPPALPPTLIKVPALLLFDTSFSPPVPLPVKTGDANVDGFPELLPIVVDTKTGDRTPWLMWSVPCGSGINGCGDGTELRRGYVHAQGGTDVAPLEAIKDARSVSWLDMDEDGTLDILVQRTGKQGQGTVNFIQNNFFNDAFFLKATVLNGACSDTGGICRASDGSDRSYHPFGTSFSGASFKYTILDTDGKRAAAQIAQLPQTAYQSLYTPYAFLGLGRTNNYIESLFVGSTRNATEHSIVLEGVIPNSKVVIIPPAQAQGGLWKRELYLRPGEWIPWVTVTVVLATIILAGIVLVFHLNEKREDEQERRRALHHINFDAL